MEDVLDLYALPTDPRIPRVCFDECPYQLLDEVREPLPPQPGKPKRQDCEYEREGTCNLFLFLEPNLGWRQVEVTKRRTKQDFAQAMKDLVDVYFPDAPLIRVVLDNLNTHTPASLYETFEPEEARRIARRHGSLAWLKEQVGWTMRDPFALSPFPSAVCSFPKERRSTGTSSFLQAFGPFEDRWVVERSFAWITRWRRLARDHEGLPQSSEAFIILSASYRMLTKLAPAFP